MQLLLEKKANITAKTKSGRRALTLAAEEGHEAVVRLLLDKTVDILVNDKDSWTALHYASRYGDEAIIRHLLRNKADITAKSKTGQTALAIAAKHGHKAVVRSLIDSKADITETDHNGWTALHYAARFGHEAVVELLVDRKSSITAKGKNGRTAIFLAAEYGYEGVARLLVDEDTSVIAKDEDGWTALHYAARHGHEAVVRLLMGGKADITVVDKDGWTALHLAARYGHDEVIRLLVGEKADLTAKGENGRTAMALAAEYGYERVVQLLVDEKANITAKDEDEWTALHYAARYGHKAVVQLLIDNKADILAVDTDGWAALHYGARYGHEGVVHLLINEKVDIGAKTKIGQTALAVAAQYGQEAVVRLFLEEKADITEVDEKGWTALHFAARYGHAAVVRLLLKEKVHVTREDEDGWTALAYAVRYGHEAVVRMLDTKMRNNAALTFPLPTPPHETRKCIHPPLSNSRDIRILELQPGQFKDPIRCSFKVVSLDDYDTDYEAMSYVWGTDQPDYEIWFSETKFPVRSNLYFALLRFRKSACVRRLWIDAICIDQENIRERNEQILLMKDVYSTASVVIIWLGKEDTLTRSVFQSIHEVVRRNEMSYMSDIQGEENHPKQESENALFVTNTWFERAWIYQEIVCSRAATVYCGTRDASQSIGRNSLPWEILSKFYEIETARTLGNAPTLYCRVFSPLIFGQTHHNANGHTKNYFELLQLLELRRDCEATNPLDKVFSLLGLWLEGQKGLILADYTMSVAKAYTDVARLLIKSRKDLRILSTVQQPPSEPDLPSWVPDWREHWRVRPLLSNTLESSESTNETPAAFTATSGRPLELQCDGIAAELRLNGKSFSKIIVLADIIHDVVDYGPTFSAKIAHLKGMGFPLQSKYPGTQLTYVAVLYRVLITHQNLNDRQELTSRSGFNPGMGFVEKRHNFPNSGSAWRLFLASNGYVGFVLAHAAVGDEICLLFGGDVPYVVRERGTVQIFVSECYCHGIMNGEAMQVGLGEEDEGARNGKLYVLR